MMVLKKAVCHHHLDLIGKFYFSDKYIIWDFTIHKNPFCKTARSEYGNQLQTNFWSQCFFFRPELLVQIRVNLYVLDSLNDTASTLK